MKAGLPLFAVLLAAIAVSEPGWANPPAETERPLRFGPPRVREQFLLGTGFLTLEPTSAEPLPRGRWQVDLTTTVTNTFAASDAVERELESRDSRLPLTAAELDALRLALPERQIFYADGEIFATTLEARRGIGRGLEIEVLLPVLSFNGGFLDSVVEGFHQVFGFDQEGRDAISRDGILVYTSGERSNFQLQDRTGLSLGDLELAAKFRLYQSEQGASLALRAAIKLPTGDEDRLASSGGVDWGAQLLATRHLDRSTLHAGFGFVFLSSHQTLGTRRQSSYSATAAWEREIGRRTALLGQFSIAQSPFEDLDFPELRRTALTWSVGLRRALRGRYLLFVGLSENIGSFDNTADVGIHLGLSRRFG